MPEPIPNTCQDCGGDGRNNDGSTCVVCMGSGSLPVVGMNRLLKDVFSSLVAKLDALQQDVGQVAELSKGTAEVCEKILSVVTEKG